VTHLPAGSYSEKLLSIAIDPRNGDIAYSAGHGIGLMDARGRPLAGLTLPTRPVSISFSSRGQLLAVTIQAVYLWRGGSVPPVRIAQPSATVGAEFNADGSRLAVTDIGGAVGVWDTSSGRRVWSSRPTKPIEA
jgi:hypothetical protein